MRVKKERDYGEGRRREIGRRFQQAVLGGEEGEDQTKEMRKME